MLRLKFEIPRDEVERRRQQIRDLWEFRRLDHIPVLMSVEANPWGYSITEQMLDREKQLDVRLESVRLSLAEIPDDYIPAMRVDVGCIVVASAFGAEVVYGKHPAQTPYVKAPVVSSIEEVDRLSIPDLDRSELVVEGLARIRRFVEATDYQVPVSLLDATSPVNAALDLLGAQELFLSMCTAPDSVTRLLDLLTQTLFLLIDRSIDAACGIENVTSTDFPEWWHPEGRKGHVSDDACADISPDHFVQFCKPAADALFRRYGGGLLHNCGPHPSAGHYLGLGDGIGGADIAYRYSVRDFPAIKRAFRGKGLVYLILEEETPQENLSAYRHAMEELAPDVIAVPCFTVPYAQYATEIGDIYWRFREVAQEYASRVQWRG